MRVLRTRHGRMILLTLVSLWIEPSDLHAEDLSQASWLLGTWKRETPSSITYERWHRVNERIFEGKLWRISKTTLDTLFTESILLVDIGGDVFYMPKVQENIYPIPFKLISSTRTKLVFENPTHDFPQRITYHYNTDTSLTAIVESIHQEGQEHKRIAFHFQREE
jgi:hypothetical protein